MIWSLKFFSRHYWAKEERALSLSHSLLLLSLLLKMVSILLGESKISDFILRCIVLCKSIQWKNYGDDTHNFMQISRCMSHMYVWIFAVSDTQGDTQNVAHINFKAFVEKSEKLFFFIS